MIYMLAYTFAWKSTKDFYDDYVSSFEDLFKSDQSVSAYQRNIGL